MVDIIAKKRREISMWSPATKGGRGEGGVATVLSKSFFFVLKRVLGSLLALENDDERFINRTVGSLVFYVYSLIDIGGP